MRNTSISALQGAWQGWDSLKGRDGEHILELRSDEACNLHSIGLAHVELSRTRVSGEVKHQLCKRAGEGLSTKHALLERRTYL